MISLKKNLAALFFLQIANYIIPLITLPWLTRVLGPEGYGRFGFAIAFIAYFTLLTDYGFNLSATHKIAIHRNDKVLRSQIFWATFDAKLVLGIGGFLVLLLLIGTMSKLAQDKTLLLVGYFTVFGSILTPSWYFQGIEHMSRMAVINLLTRATSVPLILWLISSPDDLILAVLLSSSTAFLAGALNLWMLYLLHQIAWVPPSADLISESFREGWSLFLSTAAISLYTTSNTVILGFMASNTAVGYFVAASNIVKAVQGLLGPIGQVVFPRISHLICYAPEEGFALIRKTLIIQGGITFVLSLIVFFGADIWVKILFGPEFQEATVILKWLAPLPFVIGLSNIFGIQTMVPLGYKDTFSKILIFFGLFNIIIIIPLGYLFGAVGAAAAVCFTEILVTLIMGIFLMRQEPSVFRFSLLRGLS